MKISRLSLRNFRTYPTRDFSFDPDLTVIAGPNGAGKTNVLEAVYLLATGESWRGGASEEMVRFGEEVSHVEAACSSGRDSATAASRARLHAPGAQATGGQVGRRPTSGLSETPTSIVGTPLQLDGNGASVPSKQDSRIAGTRLHITLTRGFIHGKRVAKMKYKVDGVAKRKSDFVGRLKVVLFEPQSLMIIIGDPSYRRGFLDDALSQTDAEYRNDLHVYARALKIRNRLLDAIRDGKAQREQLDYWERTMVKHGSKIQEARRGMVEWFKGQMAKTALKGLSLQGQSFFSVSYDPSVISEVRLEQYRDREIATGFSLVGPQRDDLAIIGKDEGQRTKDEGRALAQYGSRGEQRMAVLMLKLAEAEWIEEKTGESPVLLLDDIYSELDDEHDRMVAELVQGRQTIITATDMPSGYSAPNSIIRL